MESQDEWTEVKSRRSRKPKVYPVDRYWHGFEEDGTERWFIEMNDGSILTSKHDDFERLSRKYYPYM